MSPRVPDDHILDAAIAIVVEHGYAGATTREIAARAGINEVTLFRRFESKARLVRAAIHRDLGETTARIASPTGDLRADLLAVLERYCATYEDHGSLPLMIILEATRNPELLDLLDEPADAQRALRRLIADYQVTGDLIEEPPSLAVNALLGPLLAHAVDAELEIDNSPPPTPQVLLDRFLRGHGAQPTSG
jgi:AcrR family transcriptional regulator